MKTPLALTLSLFLSLGSVSGVVNQARPPVPSDFGGGGLQSPIYVNAVTGECFIYVNGTITSINSINVTAFGVKGDGVTDDADNIQRAVTASYGKGLFFPPGNYRITRQINILSAVYIWARPYTATIYMATQNQNGFVIGDGSVGVHAVVNSTFIDGLQFAPAAGVAASTSGACVFCNYASFFEINNCSFAGADGGVNKLWNAISVFEGVEWKIGNPIISRFVNNGIRAVGAVGGSFLCVDGRITKPLITNIAGDAIYFGDFTGAMSIEKPTIYSCSGWGIKFDCTASPGVGFNYFVDEPNIEATTVTSALGAIYAKQCVGASIANGWVGGTLGVQVDSTASSISTKGLQNQAATPYVISGSACTIANGDTAGDLTTTTTGILVNAGGANLNVIGGRIRQFITEGIKFVGSPARCNVTGVNFNNNAKNATGDAYVGGLAAQPPQFKGCYDDGSTTMVAASTLEVRHGMEMVSLSGATAVNNIRQIGCNSHITILGGATPPTLNNSASINLKGAVNATIPTNFTLELICDGRNWWEVARSF